MRAVLLTLGALWLAGTILPGCGKGPSPPEGAVPIPASPSQRQVKESSAASQEEVEVYVPCGVASPFKAIKTAFEQDHPGISIRMLVEGNTDLVKRLERGERPDVFVNIGDREMDLLVHRGAMGAESQTVYAYTSLVLVTSRENPHRIRALADLAGPAVKRIALADPDRVSSGYHARQLLREAGLWEAVRPKLVIKPGARGPLNLVLKGQAEAALIYSTCLYEDRTQPPAGPADANPGLRTIPLAEQAARIPCRAALTPKGEASEGARQFLAFLSGPQARAALQAWQWEAPLEGSREP